MYGIESEDKLVRGTPDSNPTPLYRPENVHIDDQVAPQYVKKKYYNTTEKVLFFVAFFLIFIGLISIPVTYGILFFINLIPAIVLIVKVSRGDYANNSTITKSGTNTESGCLAVFTSKVKKFFETIGTIILILIVLGMLESC